MNAPRARAGRARQHGFTLIELLIGLTLTVFIVAALFGGLRLAVRVWEAHGVQNRDINELRLARDWLRRYLIQAHPLLIEEQPGERFVAFTGTPDYVRFVAPLPAHLGGGGLDWITLSVLDTRQTATLNVEHRLFHPDPPTFSERVPERRVLLDGLKTLRFRFYGTRDSEERPAWHDDWVNQQSLPHRISVRAEFEDARRRWPELMVVPMVDGALRDTPALVGGGGRGSRNRS